jgi:hypothetical protein
MKEVCKKCGYRVTGGSFYKCYGTPDCPETKKRKDLDNSVD